MSVLISGSLAHDYIMDFPDSFKNHILPDHIHMLNVSFTVQSLKKEFGGCAGNIAYTAKLLDGDPIILGSLGKDGMEYLAHFKKHEINANYILKSKELLTSSAHITTDKDGNQISAFHVGAGADSIDISILNIKEKINLVLISPNSKETMIRHSKEAAEKNIPIVFDPGQQLTTFSPQELMLLIGQAKILIANDYELKLIEDKTGWQNHELLNHVEILITTLGEKGSVVRTKDEIFQIKPCAPLSVDDPTGAGDAYRAGFFTAYEKGKNLQTCGQVGSVAAVYAIENYGTQNHWFLPEDFAKRYEDTYNQKLDLS